MTIGGEALFQAGTQIPERETPEYFTFLEDKLAGLQEKIKHLREENKMIAKHGNINLDISEKEIQEGTFRSSGCSGPRGCRQRRGGRAGEERG